MYCYSIGIFKFSFCVARFNKMFVCSPKTLFSKPTNCRFSTNKIVSIHYRLAFYPFFLNATTPVICMSK